MRLPRPNEIFAWPWEPFRWTKFGGPALEEVVGEAAAVIGLDPRLGRKGPIAASAPRRSPFANHLPIALGGLGFHARDPPTSRYGGCRHLAVTIRQTLTRRVSGSLGGLQRRTCPLRRCGFSKTPSISAVVGVSRPTAANDNEGCGPLSGSFISVGPVLAIIALHGLPIALRRCRSAISGGGGVRDGATGVSTDRPL